MILFKKLFFAVPFLISISWFFYQLNLFLKDIYLVFSLSTSILVQLGLIVLSISLSSLFFIIFAALATDLKFVLPVAILGSLLAIILFPAPLSLIVWVGTLISLGFTYLTLNNKLQTYLTFQASNLLTPSIKNLASFLIITASLSYFLAAEQEIKANGFKIPDSLIDTALKFAGPQIPDVKGTSTETPKEPETLASVSLTPEQINLLKQNPEVLKQYGIDPNSLDSLSTPSKSPTSSKNKSTKETIAIPASDQLVKTIIQNQIQNLVKPYLGIIPLFLAVLFFITLHSLHSLLSIVYPLIISLTFWMFEKTGFIKFTTEMREVKKMTV